MIIGYHIRMILWVVYRFVFIKKVMVEECGTEVEWGGR